jgi:AraC-like DNA-binding protein
MRATEGLIESDLHRPAIAKPKPSPLAVPVSRHREPAARTFGDVRVAPLLAIPSLLREHELDPEKVFAQVGLDIRLFDAPENRVPFDDLGNLLEACVKQTRCPHFGLLVGQRFNLRSLGVLGELMLCCPTVREALRLASLHFELHDRGAISLNLEFGAGTAALGYSLFEGKTPGAAQILDAAIAMQYRALCEFCGRSWKPLLVQLSHSIPADITPFRKYFRAPVKFDAQISCIVFESRWLDHPIEGADAAAFAAISKAIELLQPQGVMSFAAQARKALCAMIFTGSASSANLARLFNMHERTLRRHLEEERVTVRGLVNEARRELAHHLLRDTNLPVSDIAAALRYSDVSVFARAFRGWSDTSPRNWRAKHAE